MRLIGTFQDANKAQVIASFLNKEKISNQVEVISNTDWGDQNYGVKTYNLWIYEEDQLDTAMQIVREYEENPLDPRFQSTEELTTPLIKPLLTKIKVPPRIKQPPVQPFGAITLYIIFICALLYLFGEFTNPAVENPNLQSLHYAPSSPLYEKLMYDYPKKFELIDQLFKLDSGNLSQGNETHTGEFSPGQIQLIEKIKQTPYWQGLYEIVQRYLKNPNFQFNPNTPVFEKIGQGEIWRLFTPCLLHANALHLFFNMIWLIVLGRQLEEKLVRSRYILFILLTAIFSNTVQYLMGGFQFLGYSGVICAMLTFIWTRQKSAAWEGYDLQQSTFTFMMFFILILCGIQLFSFFTEIYSTIPFSPGIANSAHISGAILGLILGKLNYFSMKNN